MSLLSVQVTETYPFQCHIFKMMSNIVLMSFFCRGLCVRRVVGRNVSHEFCQLVFRWRRLRPVLNVLDRLGQWSIHRLGKKQGQQADDDREYTEDDAGKPWDFSRLRRETKLTKTRKRQRRVKSYTLQ